MQLQKTWHGAHGRGMTAARATDEDFLFPRLKMHHKAGWQVAFAKEQRGLLLA